MSNGSKGWNPSNIKPGGWVFILLLLGLIFWFGVKPHVPALNGAGTGGSSNGASAAGGDSSSGTALLNGQAEGKNILILTTGTKKKWLSEEIDKFNNQSQSGKVSMDIMESREGMQKIFAGAEKPDVWSPSSTVWTDRLAVIGPSKGIKIHQDNSSQRSLFESPLVFLVVKDKLPALKPILSGRNPFNALAQSGRYKFGYADPLNASSGMLTMSLLLDEYADIHNASDLESVAASPGFAAWLSKVDQGLVRRSTEGSSKLESDFENDPGQRAFITCYESAALEAVANNTNLAIVYPNPTANATQVAALIDGAWMTDDKRATVTAFLNFLTTEDATADALKYYFRPANNGGEKLAGQVKSTPAGAYYQQGFRSVNLPTYTAINSANVAWHNEAK